MRIEQRIVLMACLSAMAFCLHAIAQTPATQPNPLTNSESSLDFAIRNYSELTDAQATTLEAMVKTNPDDAASRARLLKYYFLRQYTQPTTINARRDHVLWMIGNRPVDRFAGSPECEMDPSIDPDGYIAARDLWKQQVEKNPQSAMILGNAAHFIQQHDPKSAEDLLKRAEKADPTNPERPQALGNFHTLQAITATAENKVDYERQALADFERSLAISKIPNERFWNLTQLPKTAFEGGDLPKATEYSKQLLAESANFKSDWNYGNAIHEANIVLGRVALASGDTETAKTRLLDAGRTTGSPQLDSSGPDMALAGELLKKGEKDVVLQYLDLCAKFWEMGAPTIKSWKQTINAGGIPDFRMNFILPPQG